MIARFAKKDRCKKHFINYKALRFKRSETVAEYIKKYEKENI